MSITKNPERLDKKKSSDDIKHVEKRKQICDVMSLLVKVERKYFVIECGSGKSV